MREKYLDFANEALSGRLAPNLDDVIRIHTPPAPGKRRR